MKNCILAGVGGQGRCWLPSSSPRPLWKPENLPALLKPSDGAAGRSVVSHVRIGQTAEDVSSPMLPLGSADLLIGFELRKRSVPSLT